MSWLGLTKESGPRRSGVVTVLDVGSSKVCCVVARLDPCEDSRLLPGRTHQIRVHLAHQRHPVVGDTTYGRARATSLPAPVHRQMLHAAELSFIHPRTGQRLELTAPLPADFAALLDALAAAEKTS